MLGRLIAAVALACAMTVAAQGATLDDVKARGKLLCGVNPGLQGFAVQSPEGGWSGFDVDYCKAVAAATLGDAAKVEFVPLNAQERFEKLKSGAVDVLARNTTWTMERETKWPLRFVGVSYHDGQGFIVKKLLVSPARSIFRAPRSVFCRGPQRRRMWRISSARRRWPSRPSPSASWTSW